MAYGGGVFRAPTSGRGFSTTSSGGGGGLLPGASPRGYNPASGGIPGVTSPISTITGDLGGLSGLISSLTGAASQAQRGQYPGEYFSTLGTLLANTQRRAAGDISDLLPELQQGAAESAVAGGVPGSAAANTKLLRDIGLTRYGVENQALTDLGRIQSEIPQVAPFDPSAIISAQLEAQRQADLYAAAPSPEAAYRRAAGAAGGGGGGGGGGVRYAGGGGGGGGLPVGSVDDILHRYGGGVGGGYAPPLIVHGTRTGPLIPGDYGEEVPAGDEFGSPDEFGGGTDLFYDGTEDGGGYDYYDEEQY